MAEIVVDELVTKLVFEPDVQSVRKAAKAQKAIQQEALATAKAIDHTTDELKKLEREEAKAAGQTDRLRAQQRKLKQEITRTGRTTERQRRQLQKIGNALAKAGARTRELRSRSSELRKTQRTLRQSLQRTRNEARKLSGAMGRAAASVAKANAEGSKFRAGAQKVSEGVGAAVSTVGNLARVTGVAVGAVGVPILTTAANFEKLQAQLVAVTGSSLAAKDAFDRILVLAKDTPFSVEGLTESYARLQAVGIEPTDKLLTSFANTAAAGGRDVTEMAEAVAGAVTGEFEMLKRFGVVGRVKGDEVAMTFQGVTTRIGRNADEITEFMENIGSTTFAGAAAEQIDTIGGKVSNLKDLLAQIALQVGEAGVSEGFKEFLNSIMETLADPEVAAAISDFLNNSIAKLVELFDDLKSIGIANLLNSLFGALGKIQDVLILVAKAVVALVDAMDDAPEIFEAATVALIAFAAAGGGIPGVLAAIGVAAFSAGQSIARLTSDAQLATMALDAMNVAQTQVMKAQTEQERAARQEAEAESEAIRSKFKEGFAADVEALDKEVEGLGAGLVKKMDDVEKAALGGFIRSENAAAALAGKKLARQDALTGAGQQVVSAVDVATERRVSQAQARAEREATSAGAGQAEIARAGRAAREAASAAAQAERAKALKKASEEFAKTGSAAAAARAGAEAVGGRKAKRGKRGGSAGRQKRPTSPIEALQQALARPPVINVTNNQVNVTGNDFTAQITAQIVGQSVQTFAQAVLGEFRRQLQAVLAEALPTVSTSRVR